MDTAAPEHAPTPQLSPEQRAVLLREANPEPLITQSTAGAESKLWRPRRVFITPDAFATPHGRTILERAESFGAQVIRLRSNQLRGLTDPVPKDAPPESKAAQRAYAQAKTSLAIVMSPPSARKLQPIP